MLRLEGVTKRYRSGFWGRSTVDAVSQVDLELGADEVLGLIGGSGCGKSTIAKMVMGLIRPTSGRILLDGRDLTRLSPRQWREVRREVQLVFQNPQLTFHPRRDLYFSCAEPIRLHGLAGSREEERELVHRMIDQVGLTRDQLGKHPHEISGGQAQRLSIVRALSLDPRVLVCDEPTSMLDVSVQAQILQLLRQVRRERKVSMLYISHDLDVIRAVCDRVAVMKEGQIVETGPCEEVFCHPSHEYTRSLLASSLD